MQKKQSIFFDKRVLIVGGTGFVGQNLITRLIDKKARVTVFDKKFFTGTNIRSAKFVKGDVRILKVIKNAVKKQDIIVDLAALRPIESMSKPILDLEITCKGSLNILESCREVNPKGKVIFFGSSLEYGETKKLPVSEINNYSVPDSFYGVHKSVLQHYSRLYKKHYHIDSTVLRFSNIYGPESQTSQKMSIVNLFIKLVLMGKEITIYGDGSQIRDYLFIDDALNALERAVESEKSAGEVFNIGSGQPISLKKMAETVVRVVGKGHINQIPWPKDYKIDPRDYFTDYNKAQKSLHWKPKVDLEKGIKITVKRLK